MIEYIVFILQIVLFSGAFLISYALLKKNREYLGNKTLASTLALVGIYAFFTFIYKALNDAELLQYAIRIALISLTFALFLLFLTIQIIVHSTRVIKIHWLKMVVLFIIGLCIAVAMIISEWISVVGDNIDTMEYVGNIFIIFAIYIGTILIYSMYILYFEGIKKNEGETKTHMISFFLGLGWMLLGLIIEGIGANIEGNCDLFDLLLFLFLSIGVIFMSRAFFNKKT